MRKMSWVSVVLILLLTAACSHKVPLRHELALSNPPDFKIDKDVLLVMPKNQAEMVIRHKPDPLADTYVFEGGPSMKDVLVDVLGQLYRQISFSSNGIPFSNSHHDMAVEVDFKDYDIKLNIYTGNVVKLNVDYTIRDATGKERLKIPTKVSSKDRYTGGELASSLLLGAFANIHEMKESSGAAWDQATANSVAMLLDKLLEYEQQSGQ